MQEGVVTGGEGSESTDRDCCSSDRRGQGSEQAAGPQADPRTPGDRGRSAKSHGRNPGDAPGPEDG